MFSDHVSDTFCNRLFRRYNLMKRIINFNPYIFFWDGSKNVVDERCVDLTKFKFKVIIKTNKVKQILDIFQLIKFRNLLVVLKVNSVVLNIYRVTSLIIRLSSITECGFNNFFESKCITLIYFGNRRANSISHTKGVAYHYAKYAQFLKVLRQGITLKY